jgi:hypothetical protein
MHSTARFLTALTLSLLLPIPAHARMVEPAASEPAAPSPSPSDDAIARAQVLHEEGTAAYSASEYDVAIAKFGEALRVISADGVVAAPETRALILFNLGTAHDKAYDIDGDVEHLRKAHDLFARIVDEGEDFGYTAETVAQAKQHRDDIARKIAAHQPKPDGPAPSTPPTPTDTGPNDRAHGRTLLIAGGAIAGAGLLASPIWIAGIAMGRRANREIADTTAPSDASRRPALIDKGHLGDKLGIAGAVVSAVLVVTGVALIAVGATRMHAAKKRRTAVAPALAPGFAGIAVGRRF